MTRYHVDKNGNAGSCSATVGRCPYGTAEEHYSSAEAARSAYEEARQAVPELHRKRAVAVEEYSTTDREAPLSAEEEEALREEDATLAPEEYRHMGVEELRAVLDEEAQEKHAHEEHQSWLQANRWRI